MAHQTGDHIEIAPHTAWARRGARFGRVAKITPLHAFVLLTEPLGSVRMVRLRFTDMIQPTAVIRYVITFINEDGYRQLFGAQQGRNTFETAGEAALRLAAIKGNNSLSTLGSVVGGLDKIATMAVRPCECWPRHFDPKGIYFDV